MNEPAFPLQSWINPNSGEYEWGTPGLTKRELFAAMAMQGVLSGPLTSQLVRGDSIALITSAIATECADALLAELNKEQSE